MMIFWLTCLVGYPRTSAPEPIFFSVFFVDISFPIYNCKLVEDSHEVNRACRSQSGARLRFTSAKVQHLENQIAVFCGFLLFLPSKTLRKVSFYLRISLEISNFVSESKKLGK